MRYHFNLGGFRFWLCRHGTDCGFPCWETWRWWNWPCDDGSRLFGIDFALGLWEIRFDYFIKPRRDGNECTSEKEGT